MPEIQLKPLPPAESIAYFRQKGYRIGFDYRDVWRQEHQAMFTVAKAMHVDLLAEIRAGLDQALANGTTFKTFQEALTPRLQARGWWGKQEVVDPVTGEAKIAQLGSPRRLGVIFDTNMATAYSEGQWERIQRNKTLFGFLEYIRSAASHPRPTHLAYAGLVLPVDDPFWAAHMPVKEWGCKCTVIQHTGRTLAREGLKPGVAPPDVLTSYTNPRTGETIEVPQGVDPAFAYPPGGRRASLGRSLMDKAEKASGLATARVLADGAEHWRPLVQSEFSEFVARYAEGERRELGTRRVVGAFDPQILQALAGAGAAPANPTINVNLAKLSHLLGTKRTPERQAKGSGVSFVQQLPTLLGQAGEVWLDGNRVVMLCTSINQVGRVVKVVVGLDSPVLGKVGNSVISMDLIKAADFTRKGLTRLDVEDGALR